MSTVRANLALLGVHLQRSPLLSRLLLRLRQQPRVRKDPRLPATVPLVRATVTDSSIPLPVRAAIALAFEGFLRASEYTSKWTGRFNSGFTMLRRHVRHRPDLDAFEVMVPRSKGDPFNNGSVLMLHNHVGRPHCAYQLMRQYLDATPSADPQQPLFVLSDGRYLTPSLIGPALRRHARAFGLPPSLLQPHSLRIGAAFAAMDCGIPWTTIKVLGRWRTDHVALQYARMSTLRSASASAALSDPHAPFSMPFFATVSR